MLRIKRIHTYILNTFLPLLLITYSVCLFVLLMQFLWKYVNEMVGKGIEIDIIVKLFFYASLSFTSQALPLSILLASLMTFGNLGEHLELIALKSCGISLFQIMKPLVCFVLLITCISFFFQNELVPRAQIKLYTIVLSLRQKSPALDIPEGSFYKEITGYNIYVRHKDKKSGLLRNLMIYDYSAGFENAMVIVSDSGKMKVSVDKKYLILTLYNGESFQNVNNRRISYLDLNLNKRKSYQRETFRLRTILIAFDTNFTIADESIIGNLEICKSMKALMTFIDSVQQEQDFVNCKSVDYFKNGIYKNIFNNQFSLLPAKNDSSNNSPFIGEFDMWYRQLPLHEKIVCLQQARDRAEQVQLSFNFERLKQLGIRKQWLSHVDQFYKRFSMALSCFLFFFIGAPLGAIIRKGGFRLSTVLSVILYILYYMIGTFSSKMVKQAVWPVLIGVWLSTAFLIVQGIFFTYKAANDSTMIDLDTWKTVLQNLLDKWKNNSSHDISQY